MAAAQNSKYLVTGARGMLGTDLLEALFGRDVTVLGRADLDVTDRDAVFAAVQGHDVVINAAAYTAVDAAETDEEAALAVNGTAAGLLAEATASVGAKLVQVSTDYVFDGDATEPYPEDATIAPVSAYGRTKAEGEQLALAANPEGAYVVRTAWLYGAHGGNFAKTMVKLAASHDTVKVVDDQLGQPTWTADLATQIVALLDSDAPAGVYHGTNSGSASWFEFAQAVFDEAGLDPARVLPTDSSAFVRPAPRPSYSVLGHDAWARAGLTPMRPWREALAEAANRGVLQTDDHAASSR
ncbi:dTDP-4-dehydrorhamnose reductase [Frigoribacterium sp. Leaf44]|jgi:dTDP-4-dehydrorhamnose reductase|uniref:dTDP-4-dehydrorhamnose reductase n=1 Tax=Frigoribacterium sp. Leaf44 TaxID=1736220 RepID=UPI0006F771A7|nr:dTDP-4-dehydrorhamnose reductase [Frigoribacterium sp. Leaf44]KQN45456.1 NAD(P)-dependent oxidoreductase [Frigoribacterium sp. Leaf44]